MTDDVDGNIKKKRTREKRRRGKKKELMYSIDIYKQTMFFVKKARSPTNFDNTQ
jgi:hypothetical protein